MKLGKKTATVCAFVLGATILTTSAFADIMLGSGYYSLKESTKVTMGKLTDEVDSFTANANISFKVDGKVIKELTNSAKFDIANNSRESKDKNLEKGEIKEHYSYSDENQHIYKNLEDGSYSVVERRKTNKRNSKVIENPFEEEEFKDAEKILDALVGNLQDTIQVEEASGKKVYVGNLSDAEIPSVINAVSSFFFKYSILNERSAKELNVPYPKSNIYLTDAMGKAIENEDGIIESGIFTASISAEDINGVEHTYTLDFSMDIKNINNTVVKAPNLDGQKVTYTSEGYEFDSKHIGKYKNDIVEVKNNSFEKVGERFVEITSVKNGSVKGKYYEVYNEGYKADTVRSFDFDSKHDDSIYFTVLNYTNNNGEKKNGVIHTTNLQNIYIAFDITMDEENGGYSYSNYDSEFENTFIRVFE